MRETVRDEAAAHACKVVADGKAAAARRRRRLELRRLGQAEGDVTAKRIRSVKKEDLSSSSSDESLTEAVLRRWPACVSHGAVSVIGRRREMEDAVAIERTFMAAADAGGGAIGGEEEEEDFFAVYDGHGGSRVAEECRRRMHVVLAEEVSRRPAPPSSSGGDVRWKEAMVASFARVDGEVVGSAAAAARVDDGGAKPSGSSFRTVGSTAVVAVVGRRRIVVANCGDSRAVLSRDGVALPLSTDHKPDRPDELERVEAAGGRVINWNGYRVLGVLATSRSIGDYYLKPFVSAEPEVTVIERTEKDEFLILASDGLWDVVSNEVACKIARNCLNGRASSMFPESVSGSSATDAAALLAELAVARGSKDNISVVVVELTRLKAKKAAAS
uniref:protein-serine/threonine phosphatase n=1 Tax=Leersia perrieri TaxID=77586 RepID=A0A0D9WJZ7_9ORYZ